MEIEGGKQELTLWMPAAARSAETVFDPSEAAFERKYLTMGSLGK